MVITKSDLEARNYAAGAIRSSSGSHGWTGVVLSGSKSSIIPPNGIEKRLSHKSLASRADATALAQQYLDRLLARAE